jgi:hypothetical protein
MLKAPGMRTLIYLFLFIIGCNMLLHGQIRPKKQPSLAKGPEPVGFKVHFIITDNGDTLPTITLHPLTVSEERIFSSEREKRKWNRLKRDVAKVYPYSKMAGNKLKLYNEQMKGKTEKERKALLKQAESEIKGEFEDDIRDMTLNQGRILIKLIDRETGNNSFGLVKDLRGTFQAVFWQSVARIFSVNLKSNYNPDTDSEDRMIEDIITSIEDGSFSN